MKESPLTWNLTLGHGDSFSSGLQVHALRRVRVVQLLRLPARVQGVLHGARGERGARGGRGGVGAPGGCEQLRRVEEVRQPRVRAGVHHDRLGRVGGPLAGALLPSE
eukprot:1338102-Pyramimonas_sp.AAC.1